MNPLMRKAAKCVAAAVVLLAACIAGFALHDPLMFGGSNAPIGETQDGYRVDREPLLTRFPRLGPFEKCYWKADIIGKPGIGPTPYWMKGFVFLDSVEFTTFKVRYQWADVESGWEPSLDTAILGVQSFRWSYSQGFNDYVRSVGYGGKFYLDLENGIVFFDVVR